MKKVHALALLLMLAACDDTYQAAPVDDVSIHPLAAPTHPHRSAKP